MSVYVFIEQLTLFAIYRIKYFLSFCFGSVTNGEAHWEVGDLKCTEIPRFSKRVWFSVPEPNPTIPPPLLSYASHIF